MLPIWGALPARLNSMFEQEFNAVERREIKDIWPAQYPVSRGQWGSNYVATRPVRYYSGLFKWTRLFLFHDIYEGDLIKRHWTSSQKKSNCDRNHLCSYNLHVTLYTFIIMDCKSVCLELQTRSFFGSARSSMSHIVCPAVGEAHKSLSLNLSALSVILRKTGGA